MTDSTLQNLEDVLRNPAASRWLRVSIQSALDRDPVDVAADARFLAALLEARADRILGASVAAAALFPVTTAVLPRDSATRSLGVDFELPLDDGAIASGDRPVITHVVREFAAGALRSAGGRD